MGIHAATCDHVVLVLVSNSKPNILPILAKIVNFSNKNLEVTV